jgi:DNA ligase-1
MQLETLYKRTKTGAIQFYDVCVLIADGQPPIIEKSSGQLGTDKPLVHREKITEGKNIGKSNETSPQQQAESQAMSDWRKKKDEGYKSLNDLNLIIVGPTNEAMQKHYNEKAYVEYRATLYRLLDESLPQFNTDASGNVKPMLAMDWKKVKTIPYPVYIQPKLDGVRSLLIVNHNGIMFLSRSGKEYITLGHIAADVERANKELHQYFILDGEIYSDELSFQEITAAVKKQRPESLKLHFRAYDVVSESSQEDRIGKLHELVKRMASPFITEVQVSRVVDEQEVKEFHDNMVQQGYEGAMLRLPNGKYEQGTRSRSLLKVKEFNEAEFEFVNFTKGQRDEDLMALFRFRTETLPAKMMGSREQKKKLEMIEGSLVGTKLTIKHFGWTNEGKPRFPIAKSFRNYE